MHDQRDPVEPVPRADGQGVEPATGSSEAGDLHRNTGDHVRDDRNSGGLVSVPGRPPKLRDSSVLLGSDPWNDTAPKARLHALLSRLAFADTWDGDRAPAESWQFATIALLNYAETGVPHKGTFEVHRHYFPDMGGRRKAWAKRNKVKGPPPGHRFFVDALKWVTRGSTEGPRLVQQKYGAAADNTIGLARAIFAGVLRADDVNTVVMRGSQVASVTHCIREPRNLSSYLAVLTHLWLHNEDNGARPLSMELLIKAEMARAAIKIGTLAAVHEAVMFGEVDRVEEPPIGGTAIEVAQALGRTLLGPEHTSEPWWMNERASKHVRAMRPILYPLLAPVAVPETAPVALRNRNVVTALATAGLL